MSQHPPTPDTKAAPPAPPGGWQPRFGLGTLLLLMLVCCVMAAAGSYLVRALRAGTSLKAVFVIFTITAPVFLLVVLSLLRSVVERVGRRAAPRNDRRQGR